MPCNIAKNKLSWFCKFTQYCISWIKSHVIRERSGKYKCYIQTLLVLVTETFFCRQTVKGVEILGKTDSLSHFKAPQIS